MEPTDLQFVGSPCGQHGPYTFFKTLKYRKDDQEKLLSLGEFFFVKILPEAQPWIAELQLLWEDRNNAGVLLSSVRLYFLPQHTPDGIQKYHGEDEVLAEHEKVVLRAEDLVQWVVEAGVVWTHGRRAVHADVADDSSLSRDVLLAAFSANNSHSTQRDKLRAVLGVPEPTPSTNTEVIVLSYAQYCRYRGVMHRLQACEDRWLKHALISALGGFLARTPGARVLFCRETYDHPDLEDHEFRQDHLAPNLKGRPRKRKPLLRKESGAESDSLDSVGSESRDSNCNTSYKGRKRIERQCITISTTKNNTDNTEKRPSSLRNNHKKITVSDEESFLKQLHDFMQDQRCPIDRVPTLGFKEIDLYYFYSYARKLGGYEKITQKRLWKHIYDKLGGNPSNTSAATCTRRHYEKLLLPYERHINGEDHKPLPRPYMKPRRPSLPDQDLPPSPTSQSPPPLTPTATSHTLRRTVRMELMIRAGKVKEGTHPDLSPVESMPAEPAFNQTDPAEIPAPSVPLSIPSLPAHIDLTCQEDMQEIDVPTVNDLHRNKLENGRHHGTISPLSTAPPHPPHPPQTPPFSQPVLGIPKVPVNEGVSSSFKLPVAHPAMLPRLQARAVNAYSKPPSGTGYTCPAPTQLPPNMQVMPNGQIVATSSQSVTSAEGQLINTGHMDKRLSQRPSVIYHSSTVPVAPPMGLGEKSAPRPAHSGSHNPQLLVAPPPTHSPAAIPANKRSYPFPSASNIGPLPPTPHYPPPSAHQTPTVLHTPILHSRARSPVIPSPDLIKRAKLHPAACSNSHSEAFRYDEPTDLSMKPARIPAPSPVNHIPAHGPVSHIPIVDEPLNLSTKPRHISISPCATPNATPSPWQQPSPHTISPNPPHTPRTPVPISYISSTASPYAQSSAPHLNTATPNRIHSSPQLQQSHQPNHSQHPAQSHQPNHSQQPAQSYQPNHSQHPAQSNQPNHSQQPAQSHQPNHSQHPAQSHQSRQSWPQNSLKLSHRPETPNKQPEVSQSGYRTPQQKSQRSHHKQPQPQPQPQPQQQPRTMYHELPRSVQQSEANQAGHSHKTVSRASSLRSHGAVPPPPLVTSRGVIGPPTTLNSQVNVTTLPVLPAASLAGIGVHPAFPFFPSMATLPPGATTLPQAAFPPSTFSSALTPSSSFPGLTATATSAPGTLSSLSPAAYVLPTTMPNSMVYYGARMPYTVAQMPGFPTGMTLIPTQPSIAVTQSK